MKRFLVFGGQNQYPAGGMSDLLSSQDTQEQAEDVVRYSTKWCDWHQILDTATGQWFTDVHGERRALQVVP